MVEAALDLSQKSLGCPLRYNSRAPLHSYVEATYFIAKWPHSLLVLALVPEVKIAVNECVYSCVCVRVFGRQR